MLRSSLEDKREECCINSKTIVVFILRHVVSEVLPENFVALVLFCASAIKDV